MGAAFHESAIFPTDISDGSMGGPTYLTFVHGVDSGREQRLPQWPYGKYQFDAQYGAKRVEQMEALMRFYHARQGKAYGFRYRDPMDWKSCAVNDTPANDDQTLVGSAVGGETSIQLIKNYTDGGVTLVRPIRKPVSGTVILKKNATPLVLTTDYTIDHTTGIITLVSALVALDVVTGGYEFHVPCRFDSDELFVRLQGPLVGDTRIPIIEDWTQ